MTVLTVQEGIYRAARATGRGRRRRRGEFVPLGTPGADPIAVPGRGVIETAEMAELRVIEERSETGLVALRMRGTLDLATVLPFRDAAFTAIGRRPTALVLDLKRIDDVDEAGISAIMTTVRVARLLNVPFFVAPSESLRETFEVTGMSRKMALSA